MAIADATKHRPEIQGLRAIAVMVVLIYHIWPDTLPGGYVGVDVFFVISGYLITGLLLREQCSSGTIDLVRFYGRRAKRLLPAASMVMLVVVVGISLFPRMRWADISADVLASALYAQNWLLASRAVDYLASEEAASPLQHFWSLSLEEQYYLLWPVAMLVAGYVSRKSGWHLRTAIASLLVLAFAASLAYSIWITPLNSGLAYFATTTRAWELALGGLLAVFTGWRSMPSPLRACGAYAGLAMIASSAFLMSGDTKFPGYVALVPTIGSTLMLVSGETSERWSLYGLLRSAPVQMIGDLSYSLYLWHWPVIVAFRASIGQEVDLLAGSCLFVASVVLAFLSKRWVEDYFRAPSLADGARWRPLHFGAGSIAGLVLAGLMLKAIAVSATSRNLAADGGRNLYPGAAALMGKPVPKNIAFVPIVENARADLADAYAANCISPSIGRDLRECHYPASKMRSRVFAVGDSHMVQWLPALQLLAHEQGWDLVALTKTGCAFATLDESAMASEAMKSCAEWNRKALRRIVEAKPELVIIAQSSGALTEIGRDERRGSGEIVRRMAIAWRRVGGTGVRIVALRETPRLGWDAADCLSRPHASVEGCSQWRAKAVPAMSAISLTAAEVPGARLIDMTDALCASDRCAPVVGNVLVWRDKHHMTATYARTIAPMLSARLVAAGVVSSATRLSPSPPVVAVSGITKVDLPLADGLDAFPFVAQVVVDRTVRKRNGGQARQLGMEFLEGDVTIIDRLIAQTFAKAGYARTSPAINSSSTRSVFQKPGSPDVLVWVRRGAPRGESFRIRSPGARGTVYMAWDVQSQNLESENVN